MTFMRSPRASRPIQLALVTLIALFSAIVALAVTDAHDASAHGNPQHFTGASTAHGHGTIVTPRTVAFHDEMRRLWEDHVTWTRLAIISLTSGAPDTDATVGRLLENQVDIGDAIKPFYGDAAGRQLTALLQEHILIAADLIAAAKAGNQTAVAAAQARWAANADEIASFLATANPRSWQLDEMKEMLHEHLRLTTNEALARLQGDWAADVAAYDEIHLQALDMADMLSTGIIKQFPSRLH
jgi:hypothetical protein